MAKITVENRINVENMLKFAEEIGKKITNELTDEILELSQDRCQVKTGKLKGSGYKNETEKGHEVGYSADYALYIDTLPQSMVASGQAHFFSGSVHDVLEGSVLKYE